MATDRNRWLMYSQADGTLTAFQPRPGRVYALGLTYASHIRETGEKAGRPAIFLKTCTPVVTPTAVATPTAALLESAIAGLDLSLANWLGRRFPALPVLLDYEVELGMVLLDDCDTRRLASSAPLPRIGYFLANDLTARSVQIAGQGSPRRMEFWSVSKSLPGFLPVADRLWCPAEAADRLPEVTLVTRVNGQERQRASTRDIIYSPRQLLRFAGEAAPDGQLRRDDIILTGTPAGVALSVPRWKRLLGALLPRRLQIDKAIAGNLGNRQFLCPGDTLTVSADWLGQFALTILPATAHKGAS